MHIPINLFNFFSPFLNNLCFYHPKVKLNFFNEMQLNGTLFALFMRSNVLGAILDFTPHKFLISSMNFTMIKGAQGNFSVQSKEDPN